MASEAITVFLGPGSEREQQYPPACRQAEPIPARKTLVAVTAVRVSASV
jgi:hypothetical protein